MEEIKRMQENLLLIRRTVGWSAAEFGERIGVTRQTISNIENGRNKLNKTQYIAMRSVLDAEIESCPTDTEMLKILLDVLIDNPDNYSEEMRKELADKANLMVPGILVGSATREKVSKEWMIVAATVAGATLFPPSVAVLGAVSVSAWLRKLTKKNKKTKE
ncbi:MAG: helix-turn-helix transcriptional regulator [Clostridia bacterium]|nr:helix-turn-helix transcriptional regulator [Clostridia bacterium]